MNHFQDIIKSTIDSVNPISRETLEALAILVPENIIVAAFDLIDRGKVLRFSTAWGRSIFHVVGSSETYRVMVDLPSPTPTYCSCPAFTYNVLMNNNQIMCKHVLAVLLARQLDKCTERAATIQEVVSLVFTAHHTDN